MFFTHQQNRAPVATQAPRKADVRVHSMRQPIKRTQAMKPRRQGTTHTRPHPEAVAYGTAPAAVRLDPFVRLSKTEYVSLTSEVAALFTLECQDQLDSVWHSFSNKSKAYDDLEAKFVAMRTKLHNTTRALEGATNKLAQVQNTTKALEGAAIKLAKLTK